MTCNEINSKLADLLFEPVALNAEGLDVANAELHAHLAGCGSCREQLAELRATMALLDQWEAPAANPYFMTRLNARLEQERQAAPAGWFENLRSRLMFGSRLTLRPVAAMAMTAVLLIGGGTYLGLNNWDQPVAAPQQTAVVHDLETLDSNAQLLDQLETLSDQGSQAQGDQTQGTQD